MRRTALVLKGHFRTFQQTSPIWKEKLKHLDYDCFFHTWDTVDTPTRSWHQIIKTKSKYLTEEDIILLREWDPNVLIESQTFTHEEEHDIYCGMPHKVYLYTCSALMSCLSRIDPSKYGNIIVCRFDVDVSNMYNFENIISPQGAIYIGYIGINNFDICNTKMCYDILFRFNSADIHQFQVLKEMIVGRTVYGTYPEVPFIEFIQTHFENVVRTWRYGKEFGILRPYGSMDIMSIVIVSIIAIVILIIIFIIVISVVVRRIKSKKQSSKTSD